VEIDVEVFRHATNNSEKLNSIKKFREKEYDGMIINILPDDETNIILNEIAERGTKIAVIIDVYNNIDSLFTVTNNFNASGKMAFEMLWLGLSGSKRKNISVFTGHKGTNENKMLCESFITEAERKNFNVKSVYYTEDMPELAEKYAVEMLAENDTDGIYITSANSIPVIEKIISSGKSGKIKIVASDVFPKLNEYIRNGTVLATIFQNPQRQAKIAVMNLYSNLVEKQKIPEILTITPQIVMNSNMDIYEMYKEI